MSRVLSLPGFVNAHSHTFQRMLRGRVEGGDFWSWRDAMLAEAESLPIDRILPLYSGVYREMLAAGYTAVGEFHYLGRREARAVVDAAADVGIELMLLHVAYAHGGIERFRQPSIVTYLDEVERLSSEGVSVGVAPHSVRACPPDWLREIGRYANDELPLHVHADEQPREIEESVAEHGLRPIELLAECGCLGLRTTIVHATHATDAELDLVAESGARICLCPTTEANLGDGFAPVDRIVERRIPICIGSDSNVRIDPLEELRELEGIARRVAMHRNVVPPRTLLQFGAKEGAAALGLRRWPKIAVDLDHRSLAGVPLKEVTAALVFGCGADVLSAG